MAEPRVVRVYLAVPLKLGILTRILKVDELEQSAALQPVRENLLARLLRPSRRVPEVVDDKGLAVDVKDAAHAEQVAVEA